MVVDGLCPAVEVYQPVNRRQLAAKELLALRIVHSLQAADVVDRDHRRPESSAPDRPSLSDVQHV